MFSHTDSLNITTIVVKQIIKCRLQGKNCSGFHSLTWIHVSGSYSDAYSSLYSRNIEKWFVHLAGSSHVIFTECGPLLSTLTLFGGLGIAEMR